jgi:phenylpropionate dioxygenase-like ring-hydroxylating dioxygenase large terminal subunit
MSATEAPRYFTSLSRQHYTSQEIFDREMEVLLKHHWLCAGHVSQVPNPGDYYTRNVGPDSMIITRDKDQKVRAFFNTCRHRGAELCANNSTGATKQFVCPYHAWSYALDGRLLGAAGSPDGVDFDYADWPLQAALCDTFRGGIWVWLGDPAEATSLHDTLSSMISDREMLDRLEPERTKVAHQETYVIKANWKLMLENNLECYHCAVAHPALAASCDYAGFFAKRDGSGTVNPKHFPLRDGMDTFSIDGRWVCEKPLGAGFIADYSCGYLNFPFFAGPVFFADHGVNLDLAPLDKDTSQLVCQWLVHEDAVEGVDYDVAKLIDVFHTTNLEDGDLAELNQRGVNSTRFVPGPNSPTREPGIRHVLGQYLVEMGEA